MSAGNVKAKDVRGKFRMHTRMKVSLISPPHGAFYNTLAPPLGLAYIASALENQGFSAAIVDLPISQVDPQTAIRQHIMDCSPVIVGITCVQQNFAGAVSLARVIKALDPSIVTVLGGPYVSFVAHDVLQKYSVIDVVVKGEAESTFVELVGRLIQQKSLDNIPGVVYRANEHVCESPDRPLIEDLDTLPYPARHLLRMGFYHTLSPLTTIITSRGCPYSCSYCSTSAFWKHRVRFHSIERVLDEIELIVKSYGFRRFYFVDDTFTVYPERTTRLLEQLLVRNMDISWECNTRPDCLSVDLLRLMRATGCAKISLGIESASGELRDSIGKSQINSEHIADICSESRNLGIKTKFNFIVGLPGEKENDIAENFNLLERLSPDFTTCNFLRRYPGTEIAAQINHDSYTRPGMKMSNNLSTKEAYDLLRKYQQKTGLRMELQGGY